MNKSIIYVIATPFKSKSVEFNKTAAAAFMRDFPDCNIQIHYENKDGLSSIYNRYISSDYKNNYVVFLHDDVFIHDKYIEQKVLEGFKKYNIIGLAGCTKITKKNNPSAWHLMSDREFYVGEVAHKNKESIWTTVFGKTSSRALLIDGLFIGVDIESAINKQLLFDEDFKFHHYDISFCLRANKLQLSVGIIQLFCIHEGLGDSMHTQDWTHSSLIFKQKYL